MLQEASADTKPLQVLRYPTVVDRTGLSSVSIWRLRKKGTFPEPIRLSPGAIGWLESDIDQWIADRARVAS